MTPTWQRVCSLRAAVWPLLSLAAKSRTEDAEALARQLAVAIGRPRTSQALLQTLIPVLPLSETMALVMTYRIAGDVERVGLGKPVKSMWTGQPFAEDCLVRFLQVKPSRSKDRRDGAVVQFQFASGLAAGRAVEHWWSAGKCELIATRLGADPSPRDRQDPKPLAYEHPTDLVSFVAVVSVLPGPRDVGFRLGAIRARSVDRKENRVIMGLRYRVDGTCPDGHSFSFPCRACPRGYDSCVPAIRSRTDWAKIPLPLVEASRE